VIVIDLLLLILDLPNVVFDIWENRKDRSMYGSYLLMLGVPSLIGYGLAFWGTLHRRSVTFDQELLFSPNTLSVWMLLSGAAVGGGWFLLVEQVSLRSLLVYVVVIGLLASVPHLVI